jgi:hypothetical protein
MRAVIATHSRCVCKQTYRNFTCYCATVAPGAQPPAAGAVGASGWGWRADMPCQFSIRLCTLVPSRLQKSTLSGTLMPRSCLIAHPAALRMHRAALIRLRRMWVQTGEHPPRLTSRDAGRRAGASLALRTFSEKSQNLLRTSGCRSVYTCTQPRGQPAPPGRPAWRAPWRPAAGLTQAAGVCAGRPQRHRLRHRAASRALEHPWRNQREAGQPTVRGQAR